MARQSLDGSCTVAHSSIALLQERFRQLQRAKEMREERELVRQMLSESERAHLNHHQVTCYETKGLFFHSELTVPYDHKPPFQGSMYLQPNYLHSKHANLQVSETPALANMCSTGAVMHRTNNLDDSDVDTSLHL